MNYTKQVYSLSQNISIPGPNFAEFLCLASCTVPPYCIFCQKYCTKKNTWKTLYALFFRAMNIEVDIEIVYSLYNRYMSSTHAVINQCI